MFSIFTADYRLLWTGGDREKKRGQREGYSDDSLYVVEGLQQLGKASYSLAVYRVHSDSGDITWLHSETVLEMGYSPLFLSPRMDRHSRRVFIPCPDNGVTVVHLDGDRLERESTLTCVKYAVSVDVMSPDTVYVGDKDSNSVRVVDITDDRITATLETPDTVGDEPPYSLAVLGDSVMVCYGKCTLVIYRHGSCTPVRVIPHPRGLRDVTAISTDCRSNYIVTDYEIRSVFIIDANGELCHTVNIPHTDSEPWDCAVVNQQLWVGCNNGDIVIMSSQ